MDNISYFKLVIWLCFGARALAQDSVKLILNDTVTASGTLAMNDRARLERASQALRDRSSMRAPLSSRITLARA